MKPPSWWQLPKDFSRFTSCILEVVCEPAASAEPGEGALYGEAKPFAMSDRLMISRFHVPIRLSARRSFAPT
jgi:hypothetical protein